MHRRSQFRILAAILCLSTARGICPGLSIGTHPSKEDVMKNGETLQPFTFGSTGVPANTVDSQTPRSLFYFHKDGEPVDVTLSVKDVDAFEDELMKTYLAGDLGGTSKESSAKGVINSTTAASQSLAVVYRCFVGGTSAVWLTIGVESEAALKACGLSAPTKMTVIWTKFCKDTLVQRSGLNVGLEAGGSEVVLNGAATPEFDDETHTSVVPAVASGTLFYIYTTDGTSQVFGPPRLQTDETKVLSTVAGSTYNGGVATDTPQELLVHYVCDASSEPGLETDVTMTVDLCSPGTDPKECSPETGDDRYSALTFTWTKTCDVALYGDGLWVHDLLFVLIFICSISCVGGCCYNYTLQNKRGVEVVPCHRQLLACGAICCSGLELQNLAPKFQHTIQPHSNDLPVSIGQTQSADGVVTVHFEESDGQGAAPAGIPGGVATGGPASRTGKKSYQQAAASDDFGATDDF